MKINSYRDDLVFAKICKDSVIPRSFDVADLIEIDVMGLYPIA